MHSLVLHTKEVELFGGALAGQDIIECDSAVCSDSPCHNKGVCNQVCLCVSLLVVCVCGSQ